MFHPSGGEAMEAAALAVRYRESDTVSLGGDHNSTSLQWLLLMVNFWTG